jgi:hypothetical protein
MRIDSTHSFFWGRGGIEHINCAACSFDNESGHCTILFFSLVTLYISSQVGDMFINVRKFPLKKKPPCALL